MKEFNILFWTMFVAILLVGGYYSRRVQELKEKIKELEKELRLLK